jgi:diguanylate cyclase (GGDEF)-like protein
MKKVLCFDLDPLRLGRLLEAVREVGGDPVEAGQKAVHRLARAAQVVLAGGEEGVELLARLAIDRPSLLRVVVVDGQLPPAELLSVIDRAHPWAVIPDPFEPQRLHAALRDALATSTEGLPIGDQTQRIVRPSAAPDFERLVSDGLTGADNYYYLRLRLDEELERASRYTRPLSFVLVDVDDLRGINDRYGRGVGDFVLKQVAGGLHAGARAVDRVGRWAGGTFALLLPETAAGAAYGIAERLRADVAARRFQEPAPTSGEWQKIPPRLRLTVSCGVASTLRDGASRPQSLLARADAALWRAKQGGRNRSVVDG